MEKNADNNLFLGIDIGSITVKTVLLDAQKSVCAERYTRIKGDPLRMLEEELRILFRDFSPDSVRAAGMTGSGGKQAAQLIGASFINEILSQSAFAAHFHPDTQTIIEMGGEDAKLIMLGRGDAPGKSRITDFSMNTACAAGTGSFLDQQAARLELTIEEFSRIALQSKNPPHVAGRCSVFAKSDMIHLQQIATPNHDIVAGLCYGMARNFKATVGKGKKIKAPLLFLGGVAANLGMRKAFCDVLRFPETALRAPSHHHTSGAIGAALMVMEGHAEQQVAFQGIGSLSRFLGAQKNERQSGMAPIARPMVPKQANEASGFRETIPGELVEAYLGVDVGSVSTNVVVIDRNMRVLAKRYLPTAGKPLEAVKQGLAEVGAEIGAKVKIMGAGTTGSGRYLIGDMIGADVVRNEITAQATAAAEIDADVDTIFEIGGQDSKFISLRNGMVVDFEMNKACAAGTGSFLEEQAERLGIGIKRDFEEMAFQAASPCKFGERCTVFIESDLVHAMNHGNGVPELTAGLAYSIAYNYLNKVVADKPVGNHIFFQGGVAANKAVVSAFEKVTGKHITVPSHHEVTGAIGVAMLAMRETVGKSSFKGFDLSNRPYTVTSFVCADCANRCDIRRVNFGDEKPLYYGSRCEKYDVKKKKMTRSMTDLFALRDSLADSTAPVAHAGATIGIPRMLYINDFIPFCRAFFSELGYRVVFSEPTNRELINRALESTHAETCFPAKIALGHIQDLIDKKVDSLFMPSFIQFPPAQRKSKFTQACPYAQALPYIAKSSIDFGTTKTIEPVLYLRDQKHFSKSMRMLASLLGKNRLAVKKAQERAMKAQREFQSGAKQEGREALSRIAAGEKVFVLVGRNYNTCDPGMNMNLPSKIRDLGVQVMPMDFLPLRDVDLSDHDSMYWRSGLKIMAAARFIKQHPNLYAIYITNFGCGPDSFITHFFRKEMGDKPFLQLEIDEHSADAGAITRIEAFLDSLKSKEQIQSDPDFSIYAKRKGAVYGKKVLFQRMCDHAFVLSSAFRACGVEAEVLPESDDETVRIGREFSSGRECYPLALTTGDMIKATRRPDFDPEKTAFFMPSGKGPCRFGQYNRYHRQVLDRIGLPNVEILSPMQDESMHDGMSMLTKDFFLMSWRGAFAVDMLQKILWEYRPHEIEKGRSDAVYEKALKKVLSTIEKRQDLVPVLREAYKEFSAIKITGRKKPVIGVVGEIYIRSNQFSNERLVRRIEMLGGEAWVAPISEWFLYLNVTAKVSARMNRSWKALLKSHLADRVQRRDEERFLSCFNGNLRSLHEPSIDETLRRAKPYIHHSFEGEAVLSVGKAIDYIGRGVSGIINVMPFTCMPGTIASAVLKRVQEDFHNIPLLNISYEGQGDSQTVTRLEAFMHQAKAYHQLPLQK